MFLDELQGIFLDDVGINQGEGKAAVLVAFDDDVGGDAAAVLNDPPMGCLELMCERVGNMGHAAILIALRVVDGLDATS